MWPVNSKVKLVTSERSVTFTNANPLEEPDDIDNIVFYYQGYKQTLVFAVQRKEKSLNLDWDVCCITVDNIRTVNSVEEMYNLPAVEIIDQKSYAE